MLKGDIIDRTGEINYNKFGSKMIISKYRGANDLDIYFPEYNWTFYNNTWNNFQKGAVICPYEPRTCGVGYLGEGKYKTKENGKTTINYNMWHGMFNRCYSNYKNDESYEGCEVFKSWHNFQNAAKWIDENYYEVPGEKMCLDKDILFHGNKIYSPETCLIVPERINKLFTKSTKSRGEYPIGVRERRNRLIAYCSITENNKTKQVNLGRFPLHQVEEAFLTYKRFKENYIKQVADEYKNSIPDKVYQALYNYEVEITD